MRTIVKEKKQEAERSRFGRGADAGVLLRGGLLVAVLLAGCSSAPASRPANVNLSGFPPAFRDGYADGCASAGGDQTRNDARFRGDPQYAQGWRDGLDICQRQSKRPGPAGGNY